MVTGEYYINAREDAHEATSTRRTLLGRANPSYALGTQISGSLEAHLRAITLSLTKSIGSAIKAAYSNRYVLAH